MSPRLRDFRDLRCETQEVKLYMLDCRRDTRNKTTNDEPKHGFIFVAFARAKVLMADVMFEYNPQHVGDLALSVGDKVEVTRKGDDGWWTGTLRGATGNFPGKDKTTK